MEKDALFKNNFLYVDIDIITNLKFHKSNLKVLIKQYKI